MINRVVNVYLYIYRYVLGNTHKYTRALPYFYHIRFRRTVKREIDDH